jgi:hypothetical protein
LENQLVCGNPDQAENLRIYRVQTVIGMVAHLAGLNEIWDNPRRSVKRKILAIIPTANGTKKRASWR